MRTTKPVRALIHFICILIPALIPTNALATLVTNLYDSGAGSLR